MPNKNKIAGATRWAAQQAGRAKVAPVPDDPLPSDTRAFLEQHFPIERVKKTAVGVTDEIGETFRAVDAIMRMHKRGDIDDDMFQAARRFRADFDAGHLEALHAANYMRAVVDCKPSIDLSYTSYAARMRVWNAVTAVGGLKTKQGQFLWHVVGQGDSLIEKADKEHMHDRKASGILFAALETLTIHYGIKKSS